MGSLFGLASVLAVAVAVIYAYRAATASKADSTAQAGLDYEAQASRAAIQEEILLTGSANANNSGAAFYMSSAPYLFQTNVAGTAFVASPSGNIAIL